MSSAQLAELHRVVLAYLRDVRRAEGEIAARRELAFEVVSALCMDAMRDAGGDGAPKTQLTVVDATAEPRFPLLNSVTRATITTDEAAFHLNRKPQTLRGWACHENGPLRPARIHGRLAWSVAEIRKLLSSAAL